MPWEEPHIILSACNVNSESSNNTSNILYFSNNNPDNNEGPDSNDNQDPNSNGDPDDDDDDLEKESNVEEIEDHNAPERIVDDLEMVDRARKNDPEALEYLSREYRHFFDDTTKDEALKDIEEYLESEFPKELERSEREADALEARGKAKEIENMVDQLEEQAAQTSDYKEKEEIASRIEALKEMRAKEEAKAEKAERAAQSYGAYSSEEDEEEEEENSKSKRPLSSAGEGEEKRNKRQKPENNDGEDGNNSSGGGIGPFSGPGPSDPGPSNWGGGWSKIIVILGGLFETLSQVIENFINMM